MCRTHQNNSTSSVCKAQKTESESLPPWAELIDDYFNFVGELPDSQYRKELDGLYGKAQKALGRNVTVAQE